MRRFTQKLEERPAKAHFGQRLHGPRSPKRLSVAEASSTIVPDKYISFFSGTPKEKRLSHSFLLLLGTWDADSKKERTHPTNAPETSHSWNPRGRPLRASSRRRTPETRRRTQRQPPAAVNEFRCIRGGRGWGGERGRGGEGGGG